MQLSDNRQLSKKIKTSASFNKQMQSISQKFFQFQQEAVYASLKGINEDMIVKIESQKNHKNQNNKSQTDVFVIFAIYQPQGRKSFQKLILQLVKFIPRPTKSYSILYVNTLADSSAYDDFKKILQILPIEYFGHLVNIMVLQATFFHRASNWLSFGTITSYIKNKTKHSDTLKEVSQKININYDFLLKVMPKKIREELAKQQKISRDKLLSATLTGKGEYRSVLYEPPPVIEEEIQIPNSLQKSKSAGNYKKIETEKKKEGFFLEQYQSGHTGAPLALELLLYFFNEGDNYKYLEQQGIFRKTICIDDLNELLSNMNKKNYDFLNNIDNPHLIASSIKRFLALLRVPIIPYDVFQGFMEKDHMPNFQNYVIDEIRKLEKSRKMTLFILLRFFKEKIIKNSQKNLMTENNCCIVLGPCLMRAEIISMKDIIYAQKIIRIVHLFFMNFQKIFGTKQQQQKTLRKSYKQYKRQSMKKKLKLSYGEQDLKKIEGQQDLILEQPTLIKQTTQLIRERLEQESGSSGSEQQKQKQKPKQIDIVQPKSPVSLRSTKNPQKRLTSPLAKYIDLDLQIERSIKDIKNNNIKKTT